MGSEKIRINKMQEGDWQTFTSCFHLYAEELLLYATGFVGNREEAEDIVQNTFAYLWTHRSQIAPASLHAYLLRSVKNACINYKMHAKVHEKYTSEILASQTEAEGSDEDFDELYRHLWNSIQSLPDKCREIFIMGCVDGFSYKEIADKLGLSINTVKTQIKVAYKKVKSDLGDQHLLLSCLILPGSIL